MSGGDVGTALVEAGLALLRDAGLTVYHSVVGPDPRPPYVLVYTRVEWPATAAGNSLDGRAKSPTVIWYTHSVGETGEAAVAVDDRVRLALLNQRPAIDGLNPGLIRQVPGGGPPRRDEQAGSPVVDQVSVYSLYGTS